MTVKSDTKTVTLTDPAKSDLARATAEILGFVAPASWMDSAHAAIWTWINGEVSTGAVTPFKIQWAWVKGAVTVTLSE